MSKMEIARAWRYSRYDSRNTACTNLTGRISVPGRMWEFTSPDGKATVAVAADANMDGKTEVVAAGHVNLYVLSGANGKVLWSKPLTCHGRVAETSPAAAVVDINMDGRPEIIIVAGSAGATVVTGTDGSMVWQHPTYGTAGLGFGVLENDETDVFQTDLWETKTIYRLRGRDGMRIWESTTPGEVYDLPVAADVNGDGVPEVVFHSHSDNGFMKEECVCLDSTGELLWATEVQPSVLRESASESVENVSGAPVIAADFLGNGGLQILLLTDTKLALLDGEGEIIWETPTGVWGTGRRTIRRAVGISETLAPPSNDAPCRLLQGAAAGDIDGDGKMEVVIGLWPDYDLECDEDPVTGGWKTCKRRNISEPRNSLVALRGETGEAMWRYDSPLRCPDGSGMSAPVIADIDGDERMEILACSGDGHVHAVRGADGSPIWQYPAGVVDSGRLIFADINDDGFGEIVVASGAHVTAIGGR